MARVKYGALITEIAGSIAGTTFQKNRYGFTIKQKPTMVRPQRTSQLGRQQSMRALQTAWFALTDADRAAWNTYAATYPRPTRLDSSSFLNGYNYFCSYHLLRSLHDTVIVTQPTGAQETMDDIEIILTEVDPALNLSGGVTISGGSWVVLLFISRVVSTTIYKQKSKLRFIFSAISSGSLIADIASEYTAIFGDIPNSGDLVFIRRVGLNTANGQIFEFPPSSLTIQ